MTLVNPYLNFPGTTEEAFTLYKSIFGGEFAILQRFKDIPDASTIPPEYHEKIMHISLPMGNVTLMGTDAIEGMGHPLTVGTNTYLSVQAETKEEADRYFAMLSQGGAVEMPIQDMFWGAYYGSCTDRFGIQWMVNYEYPKG